MHTVQEGNPYKEIHTKRLILRAINLSDAERALDYVIRNRTFLEPWEPVREEHYYTLEAQMTNLKYDHLTMENGQSFRAWIATKEEPNVQIGVVALSNIVRGAFQSCHLGYKLDEHKLNRGYMTEAVEAVVQIAFDYLNLHRIEANIMPRNHASAAVVQKLNFINEGVSRAYLKINGQWEDHVHWVLINERHE